MARRLPVLAQCLLVNDGSPELSRSQSRLAAHLINSSSVLFDKLPTLARGFQCV